MILRFLAAAIIAFFAISGCKPKSKIADANAFQDDDAESCEDATDIPYYPSSLWVTSLNYTQITEAKTRRTPIVKMNEGATTDGVMWAVYERSGNIPLPSGRRNQSERIVLMPIVENNGIVKMFVGPIRTQDISQLSRASSHYYREWAKNNFEALPMYPVFETRDGEAVLALINDNKFDPFIGAFPTKTKAQIDLEVALNLITAIMFPETASTLGEGDPAATAAYQNVANVGEATKGLISAFASARRLKALAPGQKVKVAKQLRDAKNNDRACSNVEPERIPERYTQPNYGKAFSETGTDGRIMLSPVDLPLTRPVLKSGAVMSGNLVNKAFGGVKNKTAVNGNSVGKSLEEGRYRSLQIDSKNLTAEINGASADATTRKARSVNRMIDYINKKIFPNDTWYNEKGTKPAFDNAMRAAPGAPPYRALSDLVRLGEADCRGRNAMLALSIAKSGTAEAVYLVNRFVITTPNGGAPVREQHTMVFYKMKGEWYVGDAYFRQFNGKLSDFEKPVPAKIGRHTDPEIKDGTAQILRDTVDRPMYMFGQ